MLSNTVWSYSNFFFIFACIRGPYWCRMICSGIFVKLICPADENAICISVGMMGFASGVRSGAGSCMYSPDLLSHDMLICVGGVIGLPPSVVS